MEIVSSSLLFSVVVWVGPFLRPLRRLPILLGIIMITQTIGKEIIDISVFDT